MTLELASDKRSMIGGNVDYCLYVKPVLGSHPKMDRTKVSKTNGRLMKVESFTFDLY